MQLIASTFILAALPYALAAGVCSSSNALSWPPVGDCTQPSAFPTAVQICRACCMNNQPCFTACIKNSGISRRGAVEELAAVILRSRELNERATLTCATLEKCYKYTDGSLLCLNQGTGAYHDDVGGNGDYYSGKYTAPNGQVQTGTAQATATGTSKASSTSTRSQSATSTGRARSSATVSSAAIGGSSTVATIAGATTTSSPSSSTSAGAAVTPTPGPNSGDALRAGGKLGLLGLAVGLVL